MSREITTLQSQKNMYTEFAKNNKLNHLIDDFESYYQMLHANERPKTWYMTSSLRQNVEGFLNNLLDWNKAKKEGELSDAEEKGFDEVLKDLQQEQNSALKKLMRTALLDLYDSMAGNLDRDLNSGESYLDRAIALTDLYDRILNKQDKEKVRDAFDNGEAGNFLTKTDHDMAGNFSNTLRAIYNKYRDPHQTEAEKAKWQKLCNSYAVRPYVNAISVRVKQEEKQQAFEALPEEEQERINALKAEAERLKQNPEEFLNLSPAERNQIRQTAEIQKLEEKPEKEITALKNELRRNNDHNGWTHRLFVEKPERLARTTADLQLTTKDSVHFRKMFGSLTKLRKTEGFQSMDQLLAEGKGQDLVKNLNQAIRYTQEYIEYANQKTFMQMGMLGRKRLNAARDTLNELTHLSRAIQEETENLQNFRNQQEKLEELENIKKQTETKSVSVAKTAAKMDTERRKINMVDLDNKVNGKKAVVTEKKDPSSWVVVDTVKQAGKGMSK